MQAILAGVLSLGNVTFEPEESNGSVKVSEASQGWLKAAAVSHKKSWQKPYGYDAGSHWQCDWRSCSCQRWQGTFLPQSMDTPEEQGVFPEMHSMTP